MENLKNIQPVEDFNWDAFEQGETYTEVSKDDLVKTYDETLNTVKDKEVVMGTVTSMNKREVVVNIGFKSDGVVPMSEVRYNPDLKIGDEVEVYIESQEDKKGQLILSHKKARATRSWDRVNEALEKDEIIKGYIKCRTKGGMIVDVFGIEAFLPGSQIDVKPIRDYDVFVGKTMEFKIVKINQEFKNVVVSHKALIEAELEQQKKDIISKLEKGQVLEGTVKNITSYGVFIDLGGVDGLIHVSEMSWTQHLRSAQDFMKVGDEIEAVILTLDRDERKMSLGIKQLKADPWENIEERFPVGSRHAAKVRNFTNFGVFVEIEEGVDGLIHISDLSWTKKIKHPSEFTQIGAEIEVQVLEIDKENRRLSLGHKQLEENPWDVFETIFTVGSIHEGTIIEVLDKGAVISLPYGVEGFATPKHLVKEDGSQAQVDEKLSFKVIEFNKEAKRIILSHSRIFEDEQKGAKATSEKKASSKRGGKKEEESGMVTGPVEKTTLGDIEELAALKEKLSGK